MRKLFLIFFAASLTFLASNAWAETLEEAWEVALRQNHNMKASEQSIKAASYSLDAAQGGHLPTFNVNASHQVLNAAPASVAGGRQTTVGEKESYSYQAMLSVPIYTNYEVSNNIKSALSLFEASKYDHESVVQSLKLAVAQAYISVLLNERRLEVAEIHEQSLSAHARDVENFHEEGMVAINDLLASRVVLSNAKQLTLQASNRLEVSRAAYNRLLSRELTAKVEIEKVPLIFPEISIAALTQEAWESRPELSSIASSSEALDWQAEAIYSSGGPKVSALGGYDYTENKYMLNEGAWLAMIKISWDLFDGNITKNKGQAAKSKAMAASEKQKEMMSLISLEVRQACLDMDESRKRIEASKDGMAQAEQNLEVTKNRYQEGLSTNTEVLDAEAIRVVSLVNYDQAYHDAALAIVRVKYAAGRL